MFAITRERERRRENGDEKRASEPQILSGICGLDAYASIAMKIQVRWPFSLMNHVEMCRKSKSNNRVTFVQVPYNNVFDLMAK